MALPLLYRYVCIYLVTDCVRCVWWSVWKAYICTDFVCLFCDSAVSCPQSCSCTAENGGKINASEIFGRAARKSCFTYLRIYTPTIWAAALINNSYLVQTIDITGDLVNRTYGIHKNLYVQPFLLTIFGPINYVQRGTGGVQGRSWVLTITERSSEYLCSNQCASSNVRTAVISNIGHRIPAVVSFYLSQMCREEGMGG